MEHQHGIGTGSLEQVLPLVERGQAKRGGVGFEQADGMGIESRDNGRAAAFARPANRLPDPGLVALMKPVEIA